MKKQLLLVALFIGAQVNAAETSPLAPTEQESTLTWFKGFATGYWGSTKEILAGCLSSITSSSYYSVPAEYICDGADFVTATPVRQAGLILTVAAAAKLAMTKLDARVNATLKTDDQRQAYQIVSNGALAVATLGGLYYVYTNAPKAVVIV